MPRGTSRLLAFDLILKIAPSKKKSRTRAGFRAERSAGCRLRLRLGLGTRMSVSRVEFSVNVAQTRGSDMGINFRRADVGVAEQFLDHPQIGAVLQQMCGETVAQGVRRDVAANLRPAHPALDARP